MKKQIKTPAQKKLSLKFKKDLKKYINELSSDCSILHRKKRLLGWNLFEGNVIYFRLFYNFHFSVTLITGLPSTIFTLKSCVLKYFTVSRYCCDGFFLLSDLLVTNSEFVLIAYPSFIKIHLHDCILSQFYKCSIQL